MTRILFTTDHEYIKVDGDIGTVGITDYAQKALGDVVYVELPKTGTKFTKGNNSGVVESVKSASEIYAPVSGEITAINDALAAEPALVNQDPLGKAWFYKIRLSTPSELDGMKDESAYKAYTDGL
jgi:glycine cleavage system H protein